MDYSGSFDKDEVILHLTTIKGFRMQGCTTDADRTILDNRMTKDRGLTGAEVTFYCADNVPSDSLMEDTLKRITQYVSPSLVYSTPFADTRRAYCDALLHSLVVIDRTRDVGLIVHTYNEMTKNISGQFGRKRKDGVLVT